MKPPLIALAALTFCCALPGCGPGSESKKPETAGTALPAEKADLEGRWEYHSGAEGVPHIFWRYEINAGGTFLREKVLTPAGEITEQISGRWSLLPVELVSTSSDTLDALLKTAGSPPAPSVPVKRGMLLLDYSVASKTEIPVGATVAGESGPALEPEKHRWDLQEKYQISLRTDEAGGDAHLTINKQTFQRADEQQKRMLKR